MKKLNRRCFLSYSAACVLCGLAGERLSPAPAQAFFGESQNQIQHSGPEDIKGTPFRGDAPSRLWQWSKEAYFYRKLNTRHKVMCRVCPNQCVLAPGDRSICRSKVNMDGKLYSLAYGNPCAIHNDPVEKKPLYHFCPSSMVFSIATTGCNFRCLNCQNWEISQAKPHELRHYDLMPEKVVQAARNKQVKSIAYTYSEATTFYEYMIDTARMAKQQGLYNLWISNGYINPTPLAELAQVIDGANINLKSFDDAIYRKLNGGRLAPVLNTLKTLAQTGVHFEITHLLVPGYVDDAEMFKRMCAWILKELGPDYPLHISRFFPKYKLDRLPPTPVSLLEKFRTLALEAGIHHVYLGNVPNHEGSHTYCPHCKKKVIERRGYIISQYHLKNGRCTFCQTSIKGVWDPASF